MFKRDIIKEILENVKCTNAVIFKVYGTAFGVGYDLNVLVQLKNGIRKHLEAHAVSKSWACIGHLRPDNPFYKYTGHCDFYRDKVVSYWSNKDHRALKEYLERLNKSELEQFYDSLSVK